MRASETTKAAFFDPEYSVLGVKRGSGREDIHYLDVVTGWGGSRWTWPVGATRSRRSTGRPF